jgi:hypothetical protein
MKNNTEKKRKNNDKQRKGFEKKRLVTISDVNFEGKGGTISQNEKKTKTKRIREKISL